MSELPPYPPIDPTTYDLIVIGTGLPESVISAAASSAGKSVLHLDPNPFYGSHFSSLSIPELSSFLHNPHSTPPPPPSNDSDFIAVNLATTRPLYTDIKISNFAPDILNQHSRKFNLDISGPRVLFCADKSIDLILKSGANQYLEFKSIDSSFIGDAKGQLLSVPDSRAAIFKDKSLSLVEKNLLMRFFKLVQQHLDASQEIARISEEDLESPFVDFLTKMNLPPKIKSIILYAIAMVDYDQDNMEDCKDVIKTRDGIDRLALYSSSIGRFQNALGALIYPMYGQGELPQAFCRRAAVKGCLHVLRMPVIALLMDKGNGHYNGVRLASGQEIFSNKLVLDPSFTVQLPLASSLPDSLQESLQVLGLRDVKRKVARGICISSSSLKPELSNFLVVYPPRSLYPEQDTAIRVLQIGANLAVCPSGMFVLYLSSLCDDVSQGKNLLHAAMNVLLAVPVSDNPESSSTNQSEKSEEVKPIVLWSALYIQELIMGQVESISSTPMPDGNLCYNDLLDATVKLSQKMYPNEDFFPETSSPENSEDDSGLIMET